MTDDNVTVEVKTGDGSKEMAATVSRVAVRVPPFWKRSPDLWFLQLEAQFRCNSITSDDTKYYTLVGTLEADILTEVRDVVTRPPETGKYTTLKQRLLSVYQDSAQKRLQMLLTGISLDGKRPAQLLNQMRELAGSTVSEDVIRALWMQQLPAHAQSILICNSCQELNKLADLADKITEVFSSAEISAASSATTNPSVAELQEQIVDLQEQVKRLTVNQNQPKQLNSKEVGNSSAAKQFRSKGEPRKVSSAWCWYHNKFGKDAKRCIDPCTFEGN